MNKIIYIDMDDVVADYWKATRDPLTNQIHERRMWDPDFFFNLAPIPGAKGSIFQLSKMGFDVWFLSQPLADCPESYTDKAKWIQVHFPNLYKKLILTQDKSLHFGHYLIDDNKAKWGEKFKGTFIHFPYGGYNFGAFHETGKTVEDCPNPETTWKNIVEYFKTQDPKV